jgi:hypothetical protein
MAPVRSRARARGYVLALLVPLLLLPGLVGCGSSSSGNGVASKSPSEILSASKAAAGSASTVHVAGTLASGGTPITLDMDIAAGKGGRGRLSENGLSFELIVVDNTVYIKGSPAFYKHFGGGSAAQLFEGKWLKAPVTGTELASLASLTNLNKLLDQALSSTGALSKGASSKIGEQAVIELTDSAKNGALFVATTGKPYPIQISKHGSESGQVTFSNWDEPVTLEAPSNAIDLSQLEHSAH